jgi:hypothetical protein
MRQFAAKQNQLQKTDSVRLARPTSATPERKRAADHGPFHPAASPFGFDLSRIPVHSKTPVTIQPKLTINAPGDIHEQEADRTAEQVMRAPRPAAPAGPAHEPVVQRSASQQSGPETIPPIVHEVLRSPGQPLDARTRAFMEPRFGHDFSKVRAHADAKAVESARAVNALAYTVGRDVVFGAGQHYPETTAGKRLLAHELTHVVQQTNGVQTKLTIREPGDQYEQVADRTALAVCRGDPSPVYGQTGATVMRQLMKQQAGKSKAVEKEDPNVKELKEKVGKLVKANFKGDYKKAFEHYDADKDNAVNADEITKLLKDADVGTWATRWKWVDGILDRLDQNKNKKIEWTEFDTGMK